MPPPIDSGLYAGAMNTLTLQTQPGVYPTLSGEELDDLLQDALQFTIWQPATAYNVGDVVRPSVSNGHVYRCIVSWTSAYTQGLSGATEPIWPLYSGTAESRFGMSRPSWQTYGDPFASSQVQDGDIQWDDAGRAPRTQFDVRLATYRAWLLKAAKASADYDVVAGKDTYDRSQVVKHCQQMSAMYAPVIIA